MNIRLCLVYSLLTTAIALCIPRSAGSQRSTPEKPPSRATVQTVEPGDLTNGIYRNSFFGFTYKLTFGWVDRTDDMRRDANQAAEPSQNAGSPASQTESTVLLAAFERPPEASGETINSAVVIAAEPVSAYPGLRNAEQYFGPLTELTKDKGFTVVNEPYEFDVGPKLLMRSDFRKELGKLTMHQSTLVMMEKSYVVSFTFIGGSEEEADQLVEGLIFPKTQQPAGHK